MERHISLASELPKGDPRRSNIARQILDARDRERSGQFNNRRQLEDYVDHLRGLEHVLDYVRDLNQSNVVLDIGAGRMHAVRALAQSFLGRDLRFVATGLLSPVSSEDSLVASYRTSAELLRGIDDVSIAGILAVYSIGYSSDPELVVANIDRVLVPGGVFKGKFHRSLYGEPVNSGGYRTHHGFTNIFRGFGYDVAFDTKDSGVMLALKPPLSNGVSAGNLLLVDNLGQLGQQIHARIQQRGHPI